MAKNNKQNIMRRVVKIKSSAFSEEKYSYPLNLYAGNSPYLHSSANTFGSAANRLSAPFRDKPTISNSWNLDNSYFGKLISEQMQKEKELYDLFGSKEKFLSILSEAQFQQTNAEVVDHVYEAAFKALQSQATSIVSKATDLIGNDLSKSLSASELKSISLQVSDFALQKDELKKHEDQIKALLKYSPRKGDRPYFIIWALSQLSNHPGELFNAQWMQQKFADPKGENKMLATMAKSLSGKLNHLAGQEAEQVVLKFIEQMLEGINPSSGKLQLSRSGTDHYKSAITGDSQTSTADLVLTLENDLGEVVRKWSLSVKSSDYQQRKVKDVGEFSVLNFKFKDTSAEQLLKYYNGDGNSLQGFLKYMFTNISFLKSGKSQTVFGDQPVRKVGKTGLKVVENIVNDIISVTLPRIMLGDSVPELRTDFFFNARTKEIIPASELLSKIYNATITYSGKGYRRARALATIPAVAGAVDIVSMNKSKQEAEGLSNKDTSFVYPQNLLEKGTDFGEKQWQAMKGESLYIQLSEAKKIVEAVIRDALT